MDLKLLMNIIVCTIPWVIWILSCLGFFGFFVLGICLGLKEPKKYLWLLLGVPICLWLFIVMCIYLDAYWC